MTDEHLSDLLERAADRIPVGPAPSEALLRAERRRRRRAVVLPLAGAAAVAAIALGAALLSPTATVPPTGPPADSSAAEPVVRGRLVGLGHVAVDAPRAWGFNATRCGTPIRDTVVIWAGFVRTCGQARPRGVESVEIFTVEPWFDFRADSQVDIDGAAAERQATSCSAEYDDVPLCTGTLHVPSTGVWVRAESSTGPEEVDRLLETVRFVPDLTGVPDYSALQSDLQERSGAAYVEALREAGFQVRVRREAQPGMPAGFALGATPDPGTMLPAGSQIVVTMTS